MIPNITRGSQMTGLLSYLVGEGRSNEHTEQHLIAGDPGVMALHGEAVLDRAAAAAIGRALNEPKDLLGVEVTRLVSSADPETGAVTRVRVAADVWHCSLSLAAEEGQLDDGRWGAIATAFVTQMGFAGPDLGRANCRWVAVRHGLSSNGNDHVHLAVSLVREDGTKASVHNDRVRAQSVCRDLERKYGLAQLSARGRELGERGVAPAARESAVRRGAVEVDAHRLERAVRAASTCSVEEGEFVRRLRQAGVLVRPRYAAGRNDVVAGYSVALRPGKDQPVVWHGGGRLARDLTLPELRKGWPDRPETASAAVAEWQATAKNPWAYTPVAPGRETTAAGPEVWAEYTAEVAALTVGLRGVPVEDRAVWARAAREAAGAFSAWSHRVEVTPGPLADAARSLARSAQLRARESTPVVRSSVSRAGAAMVLMQVARTDNPTIAQALLLRELGKLSRAVYDMHKTAGDARRTRELAATLTVQLKSVALHMPPIPQTGPDGGAGQPVLSGELQQIRDRAATNQQWAAGSPLPNPIVKPDGQRTTALPPAPPIRGVDEDRDR